MYLLVHVFVLPSLLNPGGGLVPRISVAGTDLEICFGNVAIALNFETCPLDVCKAFL